MKREETMYQRNQKPKTPLLNVLAGLTLAGIFIVSSAGAVERIQHAANDNPADKYADVIAVSNCHSLEGITDALSVNSEWEFAQADAPGKLDFRSITRTYSDTNCSVLRNTFVVYSELTFDGIAHKVQFANSDKPAIEAEKFIGQVVKTVTNGVADSGFMGPQYKLLLAKKNNFIYFDTYSYDHPRDADGFATVLDSRGMEIIRAK